MALFVDHTAVLTNGIVQTINYSTDAPGFKVGATDLPVRHIDTPAQQASLVEVAAAPAPITRHAAEVPIATTNADALNNQFHAQR